VYPNIAILSGGTSGGRCRSESRWATAQWIEGWLTDYL